MSRIKSTKNMTTLHGFTCTMNEHTECSRNNDYVNLSADYRRTERFFFGYENENNEMRKQTRKWDYRQWLYRGYAVHCSIHNQEKLLQMKKIMS